VTAAAYYNNENSVLQLSAYGRRVEMHTGLQWQNLREENHFEDRGVDGRIILKWILE
jgi:hypothetical protein